MNAENVDFLVKLIIAAICGLGIGLERALRGKPAGVGTQILVIAGAMIFTYLSQQTTGDPTRIAAQIVTGIGFLGAGIILRSHDNDHIMNVTTAATIWYGAAVGMLIGFGQYFMAIVATLFVLLVIHLPHLRQSDIAKK